MWQRGVKPCQVNIKPQLNSLWLLVILSTGYEMITKWQLWVENHKQSQNVIEQNNFVYNLQLMMEIKNLEYFIFGKKIDKHA